ncbi:MAG: 50S ribosomal protein L5 [Ignavibacteria bacterium]|nr:MAG: 50S ribosomal protein L5 [Ignavibacteria bacterium]KAF0157248.1 MAG: 50S ribosomal protein L5 [Ignavibacteria bacterium]
MAKEQKVKKEQKPKKDTAPKETQPAVKVVEEKIPARLKEKFSKEIVPKLKEQLGYKTLMQVPKLSKIVLNMGVGQATQDQKIIEEAVKDLETITGQKISVRTAKQAISNFKLREGMKIGAKVTLRRERMYEFLDRFLTIALPRMRDFKGVSDKSFDGRGNYTIGLKEQIIFPEINTDKVTRVLGMDITFVTTANTDKEAYELLSAFGMPFRKKE